MARLCVHDIHYGFAFVYFCGVAEHCSFRVGEVYLEQLWSTLSWQVMASRIDEINMQLRHLSNVIRQRRHHERGVCRHWVFSADLRRTVLAAREISGCSPESIIPYVKGAAACRHWPPKTNSELHEIIRMVWASASDSDVAAAMSHADECNRISLTAAYYEVSQWRVARWCQRMNTERGCAVWTDTMLEALRERFLSIPSAVRPSLPNTSNACRKWAQRWRRRWGARYGMLQKRMHEPVELSRRKAATLYTCIGAVPNPCKLCPYFEFLSNA